MPQTRIKLCGMMRPEDAAEAARLGADAVGLILHPPAARYVDDERARRIVRALPPFVAPVGVHVDVPADQVRQSAQRLGLCTVQLHGDEPPAAVAALRPLRVVKAIRVRRDALARTLDEWRRAIGQLDLENLAGLLLETAGAGGGSGVENDWETIAEAMAGGQFEGLPPVILAGGLRPDNVGRLVRLLRPWGVDTSSGIEGKPGEKSAEKMAAFVRAVRQADAEPNRPASSPP